MPRTAVTTTALLLGALLLGAPLLAFAQAGDDAPVPPNLPEDPAALTTTEREVQPRDEATFEAWLRQRGPIPGVGDGGFLARELLGIELRAHGGDSIGEVVDIALNSAAVAEFLLVRTGDETLRAVPVDSIRVDRETRFFTALTAAQVDALASIADDDG